MAEESLTPPTTPAPAGKMNPTLIVGAIVVVALIIFILFRSGASEETMMKENMAEDMDMTAENDEMTPPPPSSALPNEGSAMNAAPAGEVRTVAVEGGSFYYKPSEIRVKKGEKVKIVLSSKDMVHDFVVDELGIRSAIIKAGDTGTVEFTADKTGTFEYYCSVGQHRKNGMVGMLIVE